mgnify:CR=1 FL=1
MKVMQKRVLSILLIVAMLLTLLPATAFAAEVYYLDENGDKKYVNAKPIDKIDAVLKNSNGYDGWYVVSNNQMMNQTVRITGNIKLILKDGSLLSINGDSNHAGIEIDKGCSLSIYGQEKGTGVLRVLGGSNSAGIAGTSGSSIQIYGGETMVISGKNSAICIGGSGDNSGFGTIGIHGGKVANIEYNGTNYGILGGNAAEGDSIIITGGTIFGYDIDSNMCGFELGSKELSVPITIDGGFVNTKKIHGSVKNSAGEEVILHKFTLPDARYKTISTGSINEIPLAIKADAKNGKYGIRDVSTDQYGDLYFFLPESQKNLRFTIWDGSEYWRNNAVGTDVVLRKVGIPYTEPSSTVFNPKKPKDIINDYTIDGNTVTIKADYLNSIYEGKVISVELKLKYNDDTELTFTVNIQPLPEYIALGDSIADGYGLENPDSERYPNIIGKVLKMDLGIGANTGVNSKQLLDLLKTAEALAKEDLSDTEIITLSIGSNDVLGPFLQLIADELGCEIDEIQQTLATMTPAQLMNFLAGLSRNDGTGLIGNTELIEQANAFANNFQKIIQILKRLAPNAKIFVTNIYNPYQGFIIPYGTNGFDLGKITDSYIQILNQAFDPNSEDYILIDVNSAFSESLKKGVNPVNADIRTLNFDPHPNKTGHKIIAYLILDWFSGEPSVSPTSLNVKVGDSVNLDIYYGKGIKVATGAAITISDTNIAVLGNGSVTTGSSITMTGDSIIVTGSSITVIGRSQGNTELNITFNNEQNTSITVPITVNAGSNDGGGSTPGDGGGSTPGGGGSSSGGSSSSGVSNSSSDKTESPSTTPIAPEAYPGQPFTGIIDVEAKPVGPSEARAEIRDSDVSRAIKAAQENENRAKSQGQHTNGIAICINITMPAGADTLTTSLSKDAIEMMIKAGITYLEINRGSISITLDLKKLLELNNMGGDSISINITPANDLSQEAQEVIGNRPAFDITFTAENSGGGNSSGNGAESQAQGIIIYGITYNVRNDEYFKKLRGVYVNESGEVSVLDDSNFDPQRSSVIIETNHNSIYGVGYTDPVAKFADTTNHWAKESIKYVVEREILSETSETAFSPNTQITRGMLVTALGKLAGVDIKNYKASTFSDVKADSYYAPYVEWAYQKGIVKGIGNNMFAPDRAITREEIAAVFTNYAKATGYKLPTILNATPYADQDLIGSSYKEAVKAMQQAGIMTGQTQQV